MRIINWILLCCLTQPVFGQDVLDVLESSGFTGGLIVHLGCGDCTEHTIDCGGPLWKCLTDDNCQTSCGTISEECWGCSNWTGLPCI